MTIQSGQLHLYSAFCIATLLGKTKDLEHSQRRTLPPPPTTHLVNPVGSHLSACRKSVIRRDKPTPLGAGVDAMCRKVEILLQQMEL